MIINVHIYEHALIFVPVSVLVHEDLTLILLCEFKHFGSNFLLFSFFFV